MQPPSFPPTGPVGMGTMPTVPSRIQWNVVSALANAILRPSVDRSLFFVLVIGPVLVCRLSARLALRSSLAWCIRKQSLQRVQLNNVPRFVSRHSWHLQLSPAHEGVEICTLVVHLGYLMKLQDGVMISINA